MCWLGIAASASSRSLRGDTVSFSFSVAMIIFTMLYGPMGAFLPELYVTRPRYSGAAVSYNLGGVFGGAFAPLVTGQLLASTGGSWSISVYGLAMAIELDGHHHRLHIAALGDLPDAPLGDPIRRIRRTPPRRAGQGAGGRLERQGRLRRSWTQATRFDRMVATGF